MFEMIEAAKDLSKAEYDKKVGKLRPALLDIQQKLRERKDLAVVILLNGVEGAGKSETMQFLTSWLDPRGIEVNAFGTEVECDRKPPFRQFWMHLPPKGKMGIFFGSWYTYPIVDRAFRKLKKSRFMLEIDKINTFERHLTAENVLIIKFWLHVSKKAQHERLKKLMKDPNRSWQITKREVKLSKHYDVLYKTSETVLGKTNTAQASWHIIDASDHRWREVQVAGSIIDLVKQRLAEAPPPKPSPMPIPKKTPKTILDTLDLKKKISRQSYNGELAALQSDIGALSMEAYRRGMASVVVFEGWDAGGKGGAIRRLTSSIDARNYSVVSIGAPTQEELAKPYLWRFWRHLPYPGRLTVFDRSWYGRVLVERVEGFCRPEDWQRAYDEINDFEAQIVEDGNVVVKYWLHLTPNEQLRRFKERATIAYKKYKLTDEDWRNRDKWNAYLLAAGEMFSRTSTSAAPWSLIEAEDKLTGRLQVLTAFRERLKDALKISKKSRMLKHWER